MHYVGVVCGGSSVRVWMRRGKVAKVDRRSKKKSRVRTIRLSSLSLLTELLELDVGVGVGGGREAFEYVGFGEA